MNFKDLDQIVNTTDEAIIFGTGIIGHTWGYDLLKAAGFRIDAYFDNFSKEESVNGIPVKRISALKEEAIGKAVFIAAKEENQSIIKRQLNKLGIEKTYRIDTDFFQEIYRSLEASNDKIKAQYEGVYDDGKYLSRIFQYAMGKPLNLEKPLTFNEKIQWLKVHDHDERYINMVNKKTAKKVAGSIIGDKYLIKTYGVYDNFDEICLDDFPDDIVIKCTHDSGTVYICQDKRKMLDNKQLQSYFMKALSRNYYVESREWPYKFVKPQIIVEEKLQSDSDGLNDYKFFCFNGVVDNIMVVRYRQTGHPKYYHFNKDWKLLRYNRLCRSLPNDYTESKPSFIDEMIELAECLSRDMKHVRIDLYESRGKIYFGEFTLYSCGGYESGFDERTEMHLGSLITAI